jgi:hypothetical protein
VPAAFDGGVSGEPSRAVTAMVLTAFTVVFVGLAVHAYTQASATWDEPIHLTAGYAGWVKHDFRIDPSHPPLLRLWAALPTLLVDDVAMGHVPADNVPLRAWLRDAYGFAHRFLYVENDADRLLYRGRFMIVVLGVVLGIFVFLWTREWLGFTSAVVALACYAFEPNLSAHASLVTTDLGVTCFIFGTVYFTWLTCRRYSPRRMAGLIVCFSLAVVSKFSALLLAPIVLVLLGMGVRRHQGLTSRRACALLAGLAIVSVAVIWAIYGFRYLPAPSTTAALTFEGTERVTASPIIDATTSWIDAHRLLPNAYTQGFLYAYSSVQRLPGFLAGRISDDGWWSYFPLAILLKTPTPLIVMVCAGLVALYRRRRDLGRDVAFILLPIIVFLGVAIWSGINVGLRHVLPVYPFAILLAALSVREFARVSRQLRVIALAVVVTVWTGEYALAYPHPLTFFNYAAGGPSNGFRYLSDSNLGWGQSLKPLKTWMEHQDVTHVNLAYFGQADPAYYGINCTHLPGAPSFASESIARPKLPGYVAISATTLTGVYAPPWWRLFYAAFRDLEPVAIIGNSIRVYWVDDWPELENPMALSSEPETQRALADALLFGFQWPDHAARHYREYLAARPADTGALVNYGLALAAAHQTTAAIAALQRAVGADPSHGLAHVTLGQLFLATRDLDAAATHAERAVTLIPQHADAHFLIARVHAVQGLREEAARDLARVLEIEPGHVAAQEYLRRVTAATPRGLLRATPSKPSP